MSAHAIGSLLRSPLRANSPDKDGKVKYDSRRKTAHGEKFRFGALAGNPSHTGKPSALVQMILRWLGQEGNLTGGGHRQVSRRISAAAVV